MPLIAQSPGVAKPANAAMARQTQVAALFNRQQMSPHAKPQDPLKLGSAHGDIPIVWASLMHGPRKPAAMRVDWLVAAKYQGKKIYIIPGKTLNGIAEQRQLFGCTLGPWPAVKSSCPILSPLHHRDTSARDMSQR